MILDKLSFSDHITWTIISYWYHKTNKLMDYWNSSNSNTSQILVDCITIDLLEELKICSPAKSWCCLQCSLSHHVTSLRPWHLLQVTGRTGFQILVHAFQPSKVSVYITNIAYFRRIYLCTNSGLQLRDLKLPILPQSPCFSKISKEGFYIFFIFKFSVLSLHSNILLLWISCKFSDWTLTGSLDKLALTGTVYYCVLS